MDRTQRSQQIKDKAASLGFALCGIARAGKLEQESRDLEEWLQRGLHGEMKWMENHFEMRTDPRVLMEGTRSIVSVLHNYQPQAEHQQPEGAPKISTYAWGEDYHRVLKRKLHALAEWMNEQWGEESFRMFTDSAPVMDKAWARRAGLGWVGKHTNLIHPKMGSWFFIGEILTAHDLEPDGPMKDYCGTCTKCMDACPTQALTPYQIDATKCISYLTIELRDRMPDAFRGKTQDWVYGCDICQEVCPWNSFAVAATGSEFKPLSPILQFTRQDWKQADEKTFKKLTRYSAMSRIKWAKWQDNLDAVED